MEVKAVTIEEARAALDFLQNVPSDTRGTIDAQYAMFANLVGFKAKLAAAIKEEQKSPPEPEGADL